MKKAINSLGGDLNPLTNTWKKTKQKIAADHIFPRPEIAQLKGYDKLTDAQRELLMNMPGNFQGLPKALNSSKRAPLNWTIFRGKPINKQYAKNLAAAQQTIKAQMESMINEWLTP